MPDIPHPPSHQTTWQSQYTSGHEPQPTTLPTSTEKTGTQKTKTHTSTLPAFTSISAENALGHAIVAPVSVTGSDQGSYQFEATEAQSLAGLNVVGYGGTGINETGPGSVASAIGAGSGSENLTASANVASAAAILNLDATNGAYTNGQRE